MAAGADGQISSTSSWQRSWIAFIEQRCALDGVAPGTAHGTLAVYQMRAVRRAAAEVGDARLIGGATEYHIGDLVLNHGPAELKDGPAMRIPAAPRRQPRRSSIDDGLRILGYRLARHREDVPGRPR